MGHTLGQVELERHSWKLGVVIEGEGPRMSLEVELRSWIELQCLNLIQEVGQNKTEVALPETVPRKRRRQPIKNHTSRTFNDNYHFTPFCKKIFAN